MKHRITPVLLVALLTSCSSSKHTALETATHYSAIDSCLWLRGLSSYFDMEGEIIVTPLPQNMQQLPIDPQQIHAEKEGESADNASIMQKFGSFLPYYYASAHSSAFTPYKISFNLHGSKRDTLQELTISKHCADSTFFSSADTCTTHTSNASSWWLKMRYRALLCLSLLLLPFAIVGIIRIYRGYKGEG